MIFTSPLPKKQLLLTQFSSEDRLEDNKFLLLSSAERALSLFTCFSVLVGEAWVELE